MKSKIEIELTEKEAGHLRTLLEGGIKISDSISQGEVFKNILDHLNSQDQEEENECECCKWDDIGYTHEPYCLLFKEVKDTPEDTEHIKAHKEYLATSKQDTPEEWEKEFEFLYGHLYIQNEDGEFCKINGEVEDMIDFIKQLLSERSFSKEELECIKRWKDACDGEFNCLSLLPSSGDDWGSWELNNTTEEKVDRLLSLNNKKK